MLCHCWSRGELMRGLIVVGVMLASIFCMGGTLSAKDDETEHKFILELGTAGEWPLTNEPGNFGGTVAVEVEPIKNWLELEFGLTSLNTTGHSDLSGDLLFKKPFDISPGFEFMIGAGPEISQTLNGPNRGTTVSAEFALDFMFWPSRTRIAELRSGHPLSLCAFTPRTSVTVKVSNDLTNGSHLEIDDSRRRPARSQPRANRFQRQRTQLRAF
jgi:hypothetical protein